MVFCGKPSKGCGECRTRKIRCDQGRPTCSQCAKGNRSCPGYRDQLSLMFRDESQQVIRKARSGTTARKAKASRKPSPESGMITLGDSRTTTASSSPAPASSSASEILLGFDELVSLSPQYLESDLVRFDDVVYLSPQGLEQQIIRHSLVLQPSYQPTQDDAICFFLRQNTWIGPLWSEKEATPTSSPSHKAMMASLASVGTAMLSRARKSTAMKVAAEKEYGRALQLLTSAVSDKQQAKYNATLAAVLMLAIFEVVTSRGARAIDNWTNHIDGAAALLELRGVEQLQEEQGLQLFLKLRYQILAKIISCLQKEARVPESVLHCAKVAMFLRPQSMAYGDRLITTMGRLSNLRADINEKILTDRKKMLEEAYSIEAELMSWLTSQPENFAYTTVEGPCPQFSWGPRPYNNRYHIYSDFWACSSWNHYRVARIIVSDLILTCIRELNAGSPLSTDLASHAAQIRNTARQLASDICASVPYHLSDNALVTATELSDTAALDEIPVHQGFIRGMVLLWPLAMAGITRGKGHPLRKWVLDCFNLIGNRMGIDQALALIEILKSNGQFDALVLPEDSVTVSDDNQYITGVPQLACAPAQNTYSTQVA
ncbi:C6 finger domain protein [Aspergillus sclerotioniger CBS 115572]|uniref:C6 finger domain protein n=1 Tax=Aspergillus sclerotioniger CBS 115572 TaxID=1450535 RepID=A0A317WQV2_9EURO|nr:C6 finger domain protein [Aspergillus sclerotioniger CBS 115572]PWY88786.1 C6 finger domain protein [Aspergillus sclerotioniger CBS 115572]